MFWFAAAGRPGRSPWLARLRRRNFLHHADRRGRHRVCLSGHLRREARNQRTARRTDAWICFNTRNTARTSSNRVRLVKGRFDFIRACARNESAPRDVAGKQFAFGTACATNSERARESGVRQALRIPAGVSSSTESVSAGREPAPLCFRRAPRSDLAAQTRHERVGTTQSGGQIFEWSVAVAVAAARKQEASGMR